jgi:glucose-specific phosphotransferase system IIA component
MGLLGRLRGHGGEKGEPSGAQLLSPVSGPLVSLSQVDDPVFSTGAMGEGFAVRPEDEVVLSPVSGTVSVAGAPNFHAVDITGDGGVEVLVHVGVDTVEMGGRGFEVLVRPGQRVKAGQALLTFSRDLIARAGFDDVVIVSVPNSADLGGVHMLLDGHVDAGTSVARVGA